MYQNLSQFIEEKVKEFDGLLIYKNNPDFVHKLLRTALRQAGELTAQVIEDAERKQIVGLPESIKIKSLITATTANWLNKE